MKTDKFYGKKIMDRQHYIVVARYLSPILRGDIALRAAFIKSFYRKCETKSMDAIWEELDTLGILARNAYWIRDNGKWTRHPRTTKGVLQWYRYIAFGKDQGEEYNER